MNIHNLKVGMKIKTINEKVDYFIIEKVLKSVVWLRLDDMLFKGIKPHIIKCEVK